MASQALDQANEQVLAADSTTTSTTSTSHYVPMTVTAWLPQSADFGWDFGPPTPSMADVPLEYADASAPLLDYLLFADTPFAALVSPGTMATSAVPTQTPSVPAPGVYAFYCADVVDALLSVCTGPLILAAGAYGATSLLHYLDPSFAISSYIGLT